MNSLEKKRQRESELVDGMIRLYCRKKHRTREGLCPSCTELREYARQRVTKCPKMEEKTFCNSCKTHCYKPEMRQKIREVMRFSGPRLLLYHPIPALKHLLEDIQRKLERSDRFEKKK